MPAASVLKRLHAPVDAAAPSQEFPYVTAFLYEERRDPIISAALVRRLQMDVIFAQLGTPILMLAPMAIVVLAIFLYRWRSRLRSRRNPLTKALLNPPGASLRSKLTEEQDDLSTLLMIAFALGAYIAGFVAGYEAQESTGTLWVLLGIAAVTVLSWLTCSTIRSFKRIQRLRLGLDGEMAAGEELNHLMRLGYHVFHDIPGANYNVDHAIVGPNGVFAVETKTRAKPASGYQANFDGRVIHYPDRSDFQAVEQAKRNAQSLSQFLSKAIGRNIHVGPIVILPGWFVKQTGKGQGCHVLASGQIDCIPKIKCERLSSADITAVAHQLERLCRREVPLALSQSDVGKYEPKLAI